MSIFDEVGGHGAVKAAVEIFYQRVRADPALRDWFADVDLVRLKGHQRAFVTTALGGPELFAGRSMADAHAGLEITHDAFDAVVEHLAITLHDLGVPRETVDEITARLDPLRTEVVATREPVR